MIQGSAPKRSRSHGSRVCSMKRSVSGACLPTSASRDTASSAHGMSARAHSTQSKKTMAKPVGLACAIRSTSRRTPSFFSSWRADGCISSTCGSPTTKSLQGVWMLCSSVKMVFVLGIWLEFLWICKVSVFVGYMAAFDG